MDLTYLRSLMEMAEIDHFKLVLFTLLVLPLSYIWIRLGLLALRPELLKKVLIDYQKDPVSVDWIGKMFMRWTSLVRTPRVHAVAEKSFDVLPMWYKVQGFAMILFADFAFLLVIGMWLVYLFVPVTT